VADLLYSAYAVDHSNFGALLSGISEYKVPLIDMFLFIYDQKESGSITLEDDLEETLTDAYSQISIAREQLLGERCSRFVLELSVPSEGEEPYAALQRIRAAAAKHYDYDQITIFDLTLPQFQIDRPIRLIELFAGIGSHAMALRDLGADFEHWRVVEFEPNAVTSYNAIHGTHFEPQDITKITGADLGITDTEKYCYIMTYSFPCQDLSSAGKQRGMKKGSGTRSGLLWEVERLLNEVGSLPQVLLMENVTEVHGEKNAGHFQDWISFLESKG